MAAKANIVVDQGADFSTTITVTDNNGSIVDLSGYTAEGQIRKHYTSSTKYDFIVTFGSPRTDGLLTLSLSSANTAAIEAGRYVYDVNLTTSGGIVSRMVEGICTVTPRVTQ